MATGMFLSGLEAAGDFRQEGKNLLSVVGEWVSPSGSMEAVDGGWLAKAPTAGGSDFTLSIPVDPESEYFFSAQTRSAGRVVFSMAGLSMSYHDQGEWQTVSGLVRSNQDKTLPLKVQLRSLVEGGEATAEIKDLVLQKVERPLDVKSRERRGATDLVKDGVANAVIIFPHENGKPWAEKIQQAVQGRTGVVLPMVSDLEATEKEFPILLPEYREKNLILPGRLATNRAIWPAYNRFLAAVDGYYPGGDGFVVRTASNVEVNGSNHLILGGSSDAGVEKAVAKFIGIVEGMAEAKSLSIPWTLEAELGGDCKAAFAKDEARWNNPEDPTLATMKSGYGKVVRWYENAMGYYWTGSPEYLQRSRDYLKIVLEERANTHQYIVEFFVRAYDMLDDSPIFTSQQVAQLDSLVLENFLNFLTITDLTWMTTFSPPYESITVTNRHQIAPWYADLIMARFLERNLQLKGELKELVDFRASEKDAFFRYLVSNRNGPSHPGIAGTSDYEEFPAMFFRYALENDLYPEFVGSGLAKETLALERLNHISGRYAFPTCSVDLPIWLGAMAHLTGDEHYQWLNTNIKYTGQEMGPFQGRYVAEVHRYQPGASMPAKLPDGPWAGIHIAPQPERSQQTEELTRKKFPMFSVRGGYRPEDDFLVVAGFNHWTPSGSLSGMVVNGASIFGGGDSRADSNGASAVRLSGYQIQPTTTSVCEQPSEILWSAELPNSWAVEVKTEISSDMDWIRTLIRLGNGTYVFRDTFQAHKSGRYLLRVGWQPLQIPTQTKTGWQMATNKGTVHIEPVGEGFRQRLTGQSLAWESVRELKKGEEATVWTLVQALKGGSVPWLAHGEGQSQIQLTENGSDRHVVIHAGSLPTAAGELNAGLVVSDAQGVGIFGWRKGADDALASAFIADDSASQSKSDELGWFEPIKEALKLKAKPSVALEEQREPDASFEDQTAAWKVDWTYDGLLRPALISARNMTPEIFDLGQVSDLREIRTAAVARFFVAYRLPKEISVAPENATQAPAADSGDWIRLDGKRVSRPGTSTGNYGESHPEDNADESLLLEGVKTRFVRVSGPAVLKFFAADEMAARHPISLNVLRDLPGAPKILLEARTEIFPAFPRKIREDDFSLSLLEPKNGSVFSSIDVPGPVQAVMIADQKGNGEAEIFALKADVSIDVFSLRGEPRPGIDLYQQFAGFQKEFGQENTRGPAGGHYMPFDFSLWRPNAKGARKMVISRYGSLAFMDENLHLEGVLAFHAYGSPGMLPHGYDFNGDGREEMLTLEKENLIHTGGDSTARVREPGSAKFWPEVYDQLAVTHAEDSGTTQLAGDPILAFQALEKFGGKSQLVFVARSNYIGLYDALKREWIMSWRPPAPITAAAIVSEDGEKIVLNLATSDGLYWTVTWDIRRLSRPAVAVMSVPLTIQEIRAGMNADGSALLATREGLFQQDKNGKLAKILEGDFHSVVPISESQIAAVNQLGQVLSISVK